MFEKFKKLFKRRDIIEELRITNPELFSDPKNKRILETYPDAFEDPVTLKCYRYIDGKLVEVLDIDYYKDHSEVLK